MDSTKDDVSQLKNNWQNYAEAVVRAIVKYLGGNYVPTPGSNYYSVQKGDSLWTIARKYNVSVDELKKYNNLSSNMLTVGQTLRIPEKGSGTPGASEGVLYTVKSGDSLWKIANQYGVSVNDLKNENNLSSDNLSVGQTLIIPVGNEFAPSGSNVYVVKSGDSLWKIANQFDVSVNALKSANNLSSDNLSVGQKLMIPSQSKTFVYTVKSGDSLYRLAQYYGTTLDTIKRLNGLTTNNLIIGQKLLIPEV